MKLSVETNSKNKFDILVSFLRSNGYKVQIQEDTLLKNKNWSLPGKPATAEEHEIHALAMENETGGETVDVVFDRIFKTFIK
jgi:hypothetical protein